MADELVTSPPDWLTAPPLQKLLALLEEDGEEARIAGGAVRGALLGEPVADVDISTTLVPRDVMLLLTDAGHKAVPTGIEHGTITGIVDGRPFEITTLRADIETDGRHAKVLYGRDWEKDARRRDLTMNALYMDARGKVYDPLGGMADVEKRLVRFVGDPETRIKEDYLRILRFFRFFAWYGAFRPDAAGLKACAKLKSGLDTLSAERVWQEMSKLLSATDPTRALLWMRQTGVLSAIVPESDKWGIDAFAGVVRAGKMNGWGKDPILRVMSVLPPDTGRIKSLALRMKLPKIVTTRLLGWAETPEPDAKWRKQEFLRWLYRCDVQAVIDRLKLAIARADDNHKRFLRMLEWTVAWQRPVFPVKGQDLLDKGMTPGPSISKILAEMEDRWVASNFKLTKKQLLETKSRF